MIYDCFLFNNELDILDIRLHELADVVDKFVITESTVTHTNKPKNLHYYENRKRYKKFAHKIIHNVITDTPDVSLPWIINDFQFSQMEKGLINCTSDDIILFGDADEIPKAEKILEWKDKEGKHKIFEQWLCYYFFNYASKKPYDWLGTHMLRYKELKEYKSMWIAKYSKPDTHIPHGGWHLSYMGGVRWIQEKISMQTHQEYNNERFNTTEKILLGIKTGQDLNGSDSKFGVRNIEFLPGYIKDNRKKFSKFLIKKEFSKIDVALSIMQLNLLHKARVLYRKARRKTFNKNAK